LFIKRAILSIVIFFAISNYYIFSNPFLGTENDAPPAVRPPSSQGFLVDKQMEFREEIGLILTDLNSSSNPVLLSSLLALAFLFGVLHAAGPGHRKTVVFTMFLSRKAKWYEPFAAAFLSSAAHAGSSLFLILIFHLAFRGFSPLSLDKSSRYLEGITFALLALLSLSFLIGAARRLFGKTGHVHKHGKGKGLYGTLLISSFFPCPGVIMILTFAISMGVLFFGVLATIALSIGMGVTISLVGLLAVSGREGLFRALKEKEEVVERISAFLELGSFLFLLIFSIWMVYPFMLAVLS